MTECTKVASGAQLNFDFELGKPVVGSFDGGLISSDGGLTLLRQVDRKLRLTEQMALCIAEKRRPDAVTHNIQQIIMQRLFAIGAGYEDVNDATVLRFDPMHKLAVGKLLSEADLASQPTISRFENSVNETELDFLQDLLVQLYVQQHRKPPQKLVLDLETTCDPVHGNQQLSFFNGFYRTFCYIPLFVFDQDGFPLAALLRAGNAEVGGDAARVLRRILAILRKAWPTIPIEFRADAAFCRREVYEVCETNRVTYYIGLKSNHALRCLAKPLVADAKKRI
ncbi:MAG: IS1380 family transposase [Cyanobacteria bacterium SZAS-4]|nr:IS1380 family transposase [Cyanobacteria bacterium SZAS-4]